MVLVVGPKHPVICKSRWPSTCIKVILIVMLVQATAIMKIGTAFGAIIVTIRKTIYPVRQILNVFVNVYFQLESVSPPIDELQVLKVLH